MPEVKVSPQEIAKTTYVECPEADADTVLIVEVAIAEVFQSKKHVFPLKQERLYDDRGYRSILPAAKASGEAADGIDGTGYGGFVNIKDASDSAITVEVSFYWTARGRIHGEIERTITIPAG